MPDPEKSEIKPEETLEKKDNPVKDEQKSETTQAQEEETPEQINWKKFREARKKEREEKERAEMVAKQKAEEAEALKKAMEAILDKPAKAIHEESEAPEEEDLETKLDKLLADRERIREEKKRKQELSELPARLAEAYSDFDQICSTENLDYFEFHHPETARAFKYVPDSFQKWADIYRAVKKYMPSAGAKNKQKIEENAKRPNSLSSNGGATASGDASPRVLDDLRKKQNWARMQRVIKGG